MEVFKDYLATMDEVTPRERMEEVLRWVSATYPELKPRIAWNQPMFTHHGTYIIGFSQAKKHFAIAPEAKAIQKFKSYIEEQGLNHTDHIIRIPWEETIPYPLMQGLIDYNLTDKKDDTKFWR